MDPKETIRYFVPIENESTFVETTGANLVRVNFEKLNSYKNFRCEGHNKFFEINLYQKNPTNIHHWRANLARPSEEIDLAYATARMGIQTAAEGNKTAWTTSLDLRPTSQRERPLPKPEHVSFELRGTNSNMRSILPSADGENAAGLDIANLRLALRFLLPAVATSFGSDSLLTLLSLDWVNRELGLDLSLDEYWEGQLTSSNIAKFLSCFETSDDSPVNVERVEDLVLPAMHHAWCLESARNGGRARLQNIVYKVLENSGADHWISEHRVGVTRVLEYGPSEDLPGRYRCNDEEVRRDCDQIDDAVGEAPTEEWRERSMGEFWGWQPG